MKVLVTGGAGFIGSNVVKFLLENGHTVTVLDNLTTGYESNLKPFHGDITFINGDVRDQSVLGKAIKGADGVCHLAASVGNTKSIEEPYYDAETNVVGTLNVLQAMRQHDVGTIVYSSSAGIFGEPQYEPVDETHPTTPITPYGTTKLCGENLCLSYMQLYDLRATALRYFNVFGVNQRYDAYGNVIPIFANRVLTGADITVFGDGEQTRDFVNVEDVAKANVSALEKDTVSGPINVGTGHNVTINYLAQKTKELMQSDIAITHGPERPGDVRHCTARIDRFKEQLGFSPSTDFETQLNAYLEWMGEEQKKQKAA